MPSVVKRPAAEDDLLHHFVYIGLRNFRAAERFLQVTEEAMQQLAEAPLLGSVRRFRRTDLSGIRTWPLTDFKNYVIHYRPMSDGILVIRVLHGARRVEKLLVEGL